MKTININNYTVSIENNKIIVTADNTFSRGRVSKYMYIRNCKNYTYSIGKKYISAVNGAAGLYDFIAKNSTKPDLFYGRVNLILEHVIDNGMTII